MNVEPLSQSECLENWEPLLDDPGISVGNVGVSQGLLVFPWALWRRQQFEVRGFDLSAPQRGAFRVAPGVFSRQFWVDDSEIFYVDDAQLFATPLLGGEPRPLLGSRPQSDPDATLSLIRTEDELFWVQLDTPSGSTARQLGVFRKLHGAQAPERFGTIDATSFEPEFVARTDSGLLVTGEDQTVLVPFNGGEQRWLAQLEDAGSAGLDVEGVYAERRRNAQRGNGEPAAYELRRAPVNGGAVEVLWQGSPGRRFENLRRHRNGWVASGWDTFDDGRHAAIFWLSDAGQESYLGCGPVGSTIRSPVEEDSGQLYFSAGDTGGPGNRGQTRWLIRVSLTP